MIFPLLVAVLAGYVLGSLPFGYLVARAHGVNIFEVGSRNPGATNVKRVLGSRAGNLVFFLDALKGALAAGGAMGARLPIVLKYDLADWGLPAIQGQIQGGAWLWVGIAGLIGALLGHSFSCFTRFKGGKGVATGAGGFLVLAPLVTLIGGLIWVATFYLSRYVSLASILAAVSLPFSSLLLGRPWVITVFGVLVAAFVVVRHRANLERLRAGTEPRFSRKKAEEPSR